MHQRAVLAGGCFWGIQDPIRKQPGIISTRVGYTAAMFPTLSTAITARMPRCGHRTQP